MRRMKSLKASALTVLLGMAVLCTIMFTACPNSAGGGGTGGGSTPAPKYAVTFGADGANGTLTAKVDGTEISSGTQVQKGKTVTFTAKPAAGYKVKGWTLDGAAVNGKAETYSLTVSKAAAVRVSFEAAPKHTITFGVDGTNGTLTAKVDGNTINSTDQVYEGRTVLFTAAPAAGYRVKDWRLDGIVVNGKAETYSLIITKEAEVMVSFELKPLNYTVTFGVESGSGTLTAKDTSGQPITTGAEIDKGETVYFTAVPATGFMTDSWTISGGAFEEGTGTAENPLANVTVNAPLTVKVSFKPAITIPLEKLDIEDTVLKGYKGEKPRGILQVPAHITEIAGSAFVECTGITEVYLPENLTKIGTYAFSGCEGIIKLSLSKKLTHIGAYAFSQCSSLEGSLEFPPNLAEIGGSAFGRCFKVSGLDFSKCTQPLTIGKTAFISCTGITGTVKLPASLASLGQGAFWDCSKVALFDFYACSNPPLTAIGTNAFEDTGNARFKVKRNSGIKELLTGAEVPEDRIDEED